MERTSRHIAVHIDRPLEVAYAYAADPRNLPDWAPGLCTSIRPEGDHWVAESGMGEIAIAFAPANPYGVLDHDVTLTTGERFHNPMRVLPDGDGCEVVFSLRPPPGASDADIERDAAAVRADLEALRDRLEAAPR